MESDMALEVPRRSALAVVPNSAEEKTNDESISEVDEHDGEEFQNDPKCARTSSWGKTVSVNVTEAD